jgi:hypothetical protein
MWINRLALILVTLLVWTQAKAECSLSRFSDLSRLLILKEKTAPNIEEYDLQRAGIERKRLDERKDRNSPPIALSLTGSLDQIAGETFESGEARLSYDLNVPLQLLNRKRSKLLDKNYSRRLVNISLEENAFFLQKALSWHFARTQKQLYLDRYEILERQLEYFEEKKKQGESVISEISKIKLERISLKNKILAVQSRADISISEFNLGKTEEFEVVDLEWSPKRLPLNCSSDSYEKLLAQDNIAYYRTQKKVDWIGNTTSLSAYASQDLLNKNEDPSIGLSVNISIISPKERGRAVRSADASLDQSFRDLRLAEIRLRKFFKEQESVEALIFENIAAINAEVSERERILKELGVRASLGQTVFEEQSAALLELSNLREVKIQRVFDLYIGWTQFIQVRGIED